MSGDTDRDRVEPGRHKRRDSASLSSWYDEGQRTGPMLLRKRASLLVEVAQSLRRFKVEDMHNERIEARPSLGFINPGDCLRIGGVSGEAVDRLCRHSDRFTGSDEFRGFPDRIVAEGQYLCHWRRHGRVAMACRVPHQGTDK